MIIKKQVNPFKNVKPLTHRVFTKKQLLLFSIALTLLISSCGLMPTGNSKVSFKTDYQYDVSELLSTQDDYLIKLSAFDYASKFKSKRPLESEELKMAYSTAMQPYSKDEIVKLEATFTLLKSKIQSFNFILPEQIYVFSESTIESGAAYTRANAICIPKEYISSFSEDQLNRVVAHEFFHVVSRYNQELRPALYGTIGYLKTGELDIPESLKSLTISNPDAPDNNYYITCHYKGKPMAFIPLLYSKEPYDLVKDAGFFNYLHDDMIAVTPKDNLTQVILENNAPLIVSKDDLEDFTEQIGLNTEYTYHPEETMADHFVMLLFDDLENLPNPELIQALDDILKNQKNTTKKITP